MTSKKNQSPKAKARKLKPKLKEKICVVVSDDVTIYDYTIFKLERLIAESEQVDPGHPDLYILKMILSCYLQGDCHIDWEEGYPMIEL